MRTIFLALAIAMNMPGFSQSAPDKKVIQKYDHGEVYITHDTSRTEYSRLVPTKPQGEALDLYQRYYSEVIKRSGVVPVHTKGMGVPAKWTPLYMKAGQYYLYGPSDWMSNFGYVFCDTAVIKQHSDGPDVNVIVASKRTNKNTVQFDVLDYNNTLVKITVTTIDKRKKIALWKFETDEIYYRLMVVSDNVKQFPLVICDCGDEKCDIEYKFDIIDFESMLNKQKG